MPKKVRLAKKQINAKHARREFDLDVKYVHVFTKKKKKEKKNVHVNTSRTLLQHCLVAHITQAKQ